MTSKKRAPDPDLSPEYDFSDSIPSPIAKRYAEHFRLHRAAGTDDASGSAAPRAKEARKTPASRVAKKPAGR